MRLQQLFEVSAPFTRSKGQSAKSADQQMPLSDYDTIRVYHGVNSHEDLIKIMEVGLSGKERAQRRYSYEGNNNPRGLFVTIDFDTAKEFGSFIIEFHARVSDLEAPVWPSGRFTGQGQMAHYFDSDDDREAARQVARDKARQDRSSTIRASDRPELATTLFSFGESQALFTGELNPNSIRAVWMKDHPDSVVGGFTRYTNREFRNKLKRGELVGRYGAKLSPGKYKRSEEKLFLPRETVTLDMYLDKMLSIYRHLDREELIRISQDTDYIERDLWPEQAKRVRSELDAL